MAGRLRIKPIHAATVQSERTRRRGRVAAVAVTLGLAALLDIGALLYALIH